jgi:hypothetical protein
MKNSIVHSIALILLAFSSSASLCGSSSFFAERKKD